MLRSSESEQTSIGQNIYLYEQNCTIMAATAIFTADNVSLRPKPYLYETGAGAFTKQNTTKHSAGSAGTVRGDPGASHWRCLASGTSLSLPSP